MAQETNQSQGPLLCTTGCGFYANPRNNGMCSVCYKDFLQRQNGRGAPPDSSSAASSTGESFLSQSPTSTSSTSTSSTSSSSTSSSSIALPATIAQTDTQCGQSSNVTTTSTAPSEEEGDSSSAAKASVADTDDVISTTSEGSAPAAEDGGSEEKPKAKKTRCFNCRKKVGLTGFNCRCGHVFCGPHRYSDLHGCTFDYRADAAARIKKENPVVVGEKVQKI